MTTRQEEHVIGHAASSHAQEEPAQKLEHAAAVCSECRRQQSHRQPGRTSTERGPTTRIKLAIGWSSSI
eukprot:2927903-Amphidinium_carterae.1